MTPVKSSNIASVAHDQKSNTLTVAFKNGTSYRYADVDAKHHAGMCGAESAGKYFATHIRGGGYKASKVE